MTRSRSERAFEARVAAAELAKTRVPVTHRNNGEEQKHRRTGVKGQCAHTPSYIANFTKGLPHDQETGLLLNPPDYQQFVSGIQSGSPWDFDATPLGPGTTPTYPCCLSKQRITSETTDRSKVWISQIAQNKVGKDGRPGADVRAWESQGAGLIFDLEGPDSHAVTLPPAPVLGSIELSAEMAEIYLMALLRDIHVSQLRDPALGPQHAPPGGTYCEPCAPVTTVPDAIQILLAVEIDGRNWFRSTCCDLTDEERARHRREPDLQHVFRGLTPGEDQGPYLSQFLLIGNDALDSNCPKTVPPPDSVFGIDAGYVAYGAIRIDQRVRRASPCKDYMTTVEAWLDVQNAADVRGCETYEPAKPGHREFPLYRAMTTPRDIATYVHYDALYEAYLNACLILLGLGVPFDPGLPFGRPDVCDKQQGFASFGGPHVLTLVTEVATRALKAVRYQKFNVHRRLRPEALAGLIDRHRSGINPGGELDPVGKLDAALDSATVLHRIMKHNGCQNQIHPDRQHDPSGKTRRYLLPMAFPEGSPMHPSYGAGHATVGGACVTILKAFFDHGCELKRPDGSPIAYEPNADGSGLVDVKLARPLTVEGELNKLAANISIGRNWAGVHYFSDCVESLRLGERIALGILEEQKLTYGENFTMTVPLFDGGAVRI
jgi:hypothetical protein